MILVEQNLFAFSNLLSVHTPLTTAAASDPEVVPDIDLSLRRDIPQTTCGFAGKTDLHGLGIRIGPYSQALATCFATYFVRENGKFPRSVKTLFMVASLIGFALLSTNSKTNYATEACLLLHMIHGSWLIGTLAVHKYSRRCWKASREQTIVRDLAAITVGGYFAWFWWAGIDQFKPKSCGTCGYF